MGTISLHRSTLSSTLPGLDGYTVGSHPTIVSLMKGFMNTRPRKHKIVPAWSVDEVLKTLITWGDNKYLEPRKLTWKLAMLIALPASNRVSELKSLDTRYMKKVPDGITFHLVKHK